MELCEELLMRDVGWRRRRRATSFWQKAASSPCVRYNTTTITHSTNTTTIIFYIWKQTNSFSIIAEFYDCTISKKILNAISGTPLIFRSQDILSLSLSKPTMGFPQ